MWKLLSSIMIIIALLGLAAINVCAIPTRDKRAVIEELGAYGLDVMDHYPEDPTTADDYYKLGVAYLFRGVPQVASEQFQKALKLNPKHVDSLVALAASTIQLGDSEAALRYSQRALEIESNNAKVHNTMGVTRMINAKSLEQLDEAETSFKKAISLDSKLVSAHANLARLYISMEKPELAIGEYEAAIAIQPEDPAAHAELARAYLHAGLTDKAMGEVQKTIQLSPNNPISHNILGEMHIRKMELDKALDEFQKAVDLEPTFAVGYKNIGHINLVEGSLDKAIEHYKKALSYRPNYGEVHYGLGDAYLLKGMIQEAAGEYENAIGLLPAYIPVSVPSYNNLAYIYSEEGGDLDKALSFAQKAKEFAPENPDVADTLGWIYYKKELYDEALVNLKDAVKGSPDNPIIRYHLGATYYKKGARYEATDQLRKALSIDAEFVEAEDANRLLMELEKQSQ